MATNEKIKLVSKRKNRDDLRCNTAVSHIPHNLDLLDFPTILFHETGYSLHTLRQSSRRSWRIGQRRPVEVKFFAYKGTMQEVCLRLMGKKLLVALAMEGKFASGGLQAIDGDDDMLTAMARELVENKGIGESADSVWRGLQQLRPSASSPAVEEPLVTAAGMADAGLPEALPFQEEAAPNSPIDRAPLLQGLSSRRFHEAEQLPLF